MVHCHTVHLPLDALLTWCTMCGTGRYGMNNWAGSSTLKTDSAACEKAGYTVTDSNGL